MPVVRPYGFEVTRRGSRTYVVAGAKVGGRKVPMVVIPVPPQRRGK